MNAIQSAVDGFIDFEGQRLAELLTTVLLVASGIVAWIVGFVLGDLKFTVYVGLAGTALTFLTVVPPWPFYNKHPQRWLPAGTTEVEKKAK
ncbi:microsomal signal peptidase 12kDa subunit [Tricharina praecox]|uniref:microsomal signal peptidase 12kDa subunit n=1 Tax=Tricharina praecox TaxID=43433 RepID=UPI00221F908C|nr:microsomal signal peptidase 12kDa subunit [Tricharina praecox]KAI5854951.1 microsomal signal peptidase 12kDa subunit [Tricharina praecox]